MKKQLTLCLMLAVILTLTACFGRGGGSTTEDTNQPTIPGHTHDGVAARPLEGELTILAPAHFARALNFAAAEMAQSRNFAIHVTSFNPDTHAEYWAQHAHNFDMFFTDPHQPLWQLAQDGLLADFFYLIDNCTSFIQTDFYTQALHALTVDGALHFFPLGFGIQYVGISNVAFPQYMVDEFLQLESITTLQMMEMFSEMPPQVFYQYNMLLGEVIATRINTQFATCRDMLYPGFLTWNMMTNFIDMNTRTTDLTNPTFVRFLELMRGHFDIEIDNDMMMRNNFRHNTRGLVWERYHSNGEAWTLQLGTRIPFGFVASPTDMLNWSRHYGFAIHNEFLLPMNVIAPFYDSDSAPGFVGFIPLVDERGAVKTNMASQFPWKTLAVANNDNAQLAWEFISQYLIPATVCPDITGRESQITPMLFARPNIGNHSLDTPITRSLTEEHIRHIFEMSNYLQWVHFVMDEEGGYTEPRTGLPIIGVYGADPVTQNQTIENALNHMAEMNERPLAPIPLVPMDVFEHIVFNMLRGMVSPQEAAQQIDNAVREWLN